MPIMAERDFECVVCGSPFSMVSGDLVIPYYLVCDDCREALSPLDEESLRQRLSEQVTREALDSRKQVIWRDDPQKLVDLIAKHIQG
jgi:hypothetical protein